MVETQRGLFGGASGSVENFSFRYSGDSFYKKIKSSALRANLNSTEKLMKSIISELNDEFHLKINIKDIDIYVNTREGSYIFDYSIFFGGTIALGIFSNFLYDVFKVVSKGSIKSLRGNFNSKIEHSKGDVFYEEVIPRLSLKELNGFIRPLEYPNDSFSYSSPTIKDEIIFKYSQKKEFKDNINKIIQESPIIKKREILRGILTRLDIQKKYMFLPIANCDSPIPATFSNANLSEIIDIFGKEVFIEGISHYKAGELKMVEILKYNLINKKIDDYF